MPKTYRFQRVQWIARPIQEVFAFFSDAGNLERLTPANLRFKIITPPPVHIQPGAVIDYKLRISGMWFRWRTVIESVDAPREFVDVQAKGPYRLWRHTHRFYDIEGGTLAVDTVEYQMPLGIIGRFARGLFVRRQLDQIFDYREQKLAEIFGPEQEVATS